MKRIYWERLSASVRTRCKNAQSALRNTQTSCQNRTVAVAPMCTVGHSACSAYSPHLLSKVGINKGRDIALTLVPGGPVCERCNSCQSFRLESNTATTKALFSSYFPSRTLSPAIAWAGVCFLLLLLTLLPRPGQLRGSFRGVVANGAKAFHF